MMERLPQSEFSENERMLIAKLREKGLDDPETRELLTRWSDTLWAEANAANTSRANIELNLKSARLYRAAGYHNEAWNSLEAAHLAAHNESAKDLLIQVETVMDEMDAERGEE
jgi:hypothetical protein